MIDPNIIKLKEDLYFWKKAHLTSQKFLYKYREEQLRMKEKIKNLELIISKILKTIQV